MASPPGAALKTTHHRLWKQNFFAQAANAHLVMEAVLAGELHGGVAAQRSALHRAVRGYAAADTAEVGQLAIAQAALPHRHRQLPPAANGQRLPTSPKGRTLIHFHGFAG